MQVIFTTGSACSNWDNTLTPDCWPESWGGGGGGGGGGGMERKERKSNSNTIVHATSRSIQYIHC